ncbi:amino acid adenylation domain-containing protein [Chitinophaga sp. CF118]|uniref:non-ribosomal peptide synthetase n=1 Tax=Chitinophaga sp. CF118 TaxID=1884367 RepID=UPI0008E5CFE1|nr:non-ribosomal peptide synthetase [Chitinophaga sp. CF118]SFD21717.1 amino acid adenylation domain-containing protein [Chitinophaga sp. CF118]
MKIIKKGRKIVEIDSISVLKQSAPLPPVYNNDLDTESTLNLICEKAVLQFLLELGLTAGAWPSLDVLRKKMGITERYTRLFEELIRCMDVSGFIQLQGNNIIIPEAMRESLQGFQAAPELKRLKETCQGYDAHIHLLTLCLSSFRNILTGKVLATEVLFPEGKLDNILNLYKGNYKSDYFNELVAETVAGSIAASVKYLMPGEKIRILEAGAGTGGTSELIFKKLLPFKDQVVYVYTDISRSFLLHAEASYKGIAPYLETALFNVEQSATAQGFLPGSFDIVIAANVVHATKNIADTLSDIKVLLKKDGMLLLNEIVRTELFTTLTFGLLDGWWLYEDAALRITGSPALAPASWQIVLTETGYGKVCFYPGGNHLPQQVIASVSDGMVILNSNSIEVAKAEKVTIADSDIQTQAEKYLKGVFAGILKLDEQRLNVTAGFELLGIDSILIGSLSRILSKEFGPVPATTFFEYRNIRELAEYFAIQHPEHFNGISKTAEVNTVPAISHTNAEADDIAIIGISGKYPGADNIDAFWENLKAGKDSITEIPAERWDNDVYYDARKGKEGKINTRYGGFINGVAEFDPLFFNISPKEAELIDPQERLFLQTVWAAIEDAGYAASELSQRATKKVVRTGVYVGVMYEEYPLTGPGLGAIPSSIANRVSYFCDFNGPSMAVDTMCSSSLTAINLACNDLRLGETDVAIAGGVNVSIHPNKYILLSQATFLSGRGRCESFGSEGEGFIPGEGVGAVVLKRLSNAIADGDRIYGVIKASAVNHGGKANGYTVPNPRSQAAVIKNAITKAGISAEDISYIEAHGTGTSLGDPIEIAGLTRAFQSDKRQYCRIGSVKSNIGHCESAAGISGITKVLLQLQHQQLVPSLHSAVLNPAIDFEHSPFLVQQSLEEWTTENNKLRIAGVSGFGAGGSNAHLIIAEYRPPAGVPYQHTGVFIIPLSARNETRLKEVVNNLKKYLENKPASRLEDIAYTLQTGREAMEERLVVIVSDRNELINQLTHYLSGTATGIFAGNIRKQDAELLLEGPAIDRAIAMEDPATLARLWVRGVHIDWTILYRANRPEKISLPSYPFARQQYWAAKTVAPLKQDSINETVFFSPKWLPSVITAKDSLKEIRQYLIKIGTTEGDVIADNYKGEIFNWKADDPMVYCVQLLELVKKVIREQQPARITVLHEHGMAADCNFATGLFRTFQLGNQQLSGQVLGVDSLRADIGHILAAEVFSKDIEVRYRSGKREVNVLQVLSLPAVAPLTVRDGGVYLITGGTGGLGKIFASWLGAKHKQLKLILTGRGPLTKEKSALTDSIPGAEYYPCDVSNVNELRTLIQTIKQKYGSINGILHCAGVAPSFEVSALEQQDMISSAVLLPKVTGTVLLDELTQQEPLDFVMYCSSISGTLDGVIGTNQADYALANAYLNSYAHKRNREVANGIKRGRTISINWPVWEDSGMYHKDSDSWMEKVWDIKSLSAQTGLAAFETIMQQDAAQVMVLYGEPDRLISSFAAINEGQQEQLSPDLSRQVTGKILEMISILLKLPVNDIDPTVELGEYGFDSVSLTKFAAELNDYYGLQLKPTVFYNYRTLEELITFLQGNHAEKLLLRHPAVTALRLSPAPVKERIISAAPISPVIEREGVAIIGISGRFPGSKNLDDFWEHLAANRDLIVEVPAERWDWKKYDGDPMIDKGKTRAKWGGFIHDTDKFDPLFFGISPKEAELMDPQQRLTMEAVYHALEDAGIDVKSLSGTNTGIFIGSYFDDYASLIQRNNSIQEAQAATGLSHSILTNRISYLFNLHGPSEPVDTACSSSLVAIHRAVENIHNGSCNLVIAGGVSLDLIPETLMPLSQSGMLSPDGRCRTFDQRANGYVRGEGIGIVILKPLSKAIADGDHIYGVIRGTAVNHGGKANTLTSPNPLAQRDLLLKAYRTANIDPRNVSYIEAHGTGTPLGDPIETEGLKLAFEELYKERQLPLPEKPYCGIGSVKTNIGHLEAAAGIAGVMKVLLSLQHQTLPGNPHLQVPNEYLQLEGSPFYLRKNTTPWTINSDQARIAGISSFGFGGANAHIIIEEYQQAITAAFVNTSPAIILLSAKQEDQMKEQAKHLLDYIQAHPAVNIHSIAYTLQVGREAMEERFAIVVNDKNDLEKRLTEYLSGKTADVFTGNVKRDKTDFLLKGGAGNAYINYAIENKELSAIAQLWVKGGKIDWNLLYPDNKPEKISLPGYPFARQRYWVPDQEDELPQYHMEERHTLPDQLVLLSAQWEIMPVQSRQVSKAVREIIVVTASGLFPERTGLHVIENLSPIAFTIALYKIVQEAITYKQPVRITLLHENANAGNCSFAAGLFRTFQLGNHPLSGQVLGIDSYDMPVASLNVILEKEIGSRDIEVRYLNGSREAKVLQQVTTKEPTIHALPLKTEGVYLITGGSGGLGKIFATYLSGLNKNIRLVLTGRSAADAAKTWINAIPGAVYYPCDVSNKEDVTALISMIKREYGSLNGIIHAAGVSPSFSSSVLTHIDDLITSPVLLPKITGTVNLDEATKDEPLDFVTYFSSVSGTLDGVLGIEQSHYAIANAWLNIYAQQRNMEVAAGLKKGRTISINWPVWKEGGMYHQDSDSWMERVWGLKSLPVEKGMLAFEKILELAHQQIIVLYGQEERLIKSFTRSKKEKTGIDRTILQGKTAQKLQEMVGQLLKLPVSSIKPDEELGSYGLDSILLTKFTARLNEYYELELTPTVFYNYPTVADLAAFLVEEHSENAERRHTSAGRQVLNEVHPQVVRRQPVVAQSQSSRKAVAVIGMNGRFPGSADLETFWKHLEANRDLVVEVPANRWDWKKYDGDPQQDKSKTRARWGGFIDNIDSFDPLFFSISPKEATLMDPQQRITLEAVYHALEDAGINIKELSGSDTGVFIGAYFNDYASLVQHHHLTHEALLATGISHSILANRISYLFNLHGPSQPVDTACSSSLVAIHRAVEQISYGNCEIVIAGGVSLDLVPETLLPLTQAGMLSPDGRCKTFDQDANGYVRGEGVGIIILKSLDKAIEDGDHIYGVIRGTAENHGGKANTLTSPNPVAQKELLLKAYRNAGVDPRDVSYIETHGTGTPLGDPIETEALKLAFKELYKDHKLPQPESPYCALGSVKSNIGHLEAAAGIAGVMKVLLALQHQVLPGNPHLKTPNSYLKLEGSPFYLQQETTSWNTVHNKPRIAGISSFGFGGANAHVIIEEYQPPVSADNTMEVPAIIVLSARNESSLKEQVAQLSRYLNNHPDTNLYDMAYTLQVGRVAMEERLSVTVNSVEQLQEYLREYLQGNEGMTRGNVTSGKKQLQLLQGMLGAELVSKLINEGHYEALPDLWCAGVTLDWNLIYTGPHPRKISLPGYAFERNRYWFDNHTKQPVTPVHTAIAPPAPEVIIAPPALSTGKIKLEDDLFSPENKPETKIVLENIWQQQVVNIPEPFIVPAPLPLPVITMNKTITATLSDKLSAAEVRNTLADLLKESLYLEEEIGTETKFNDYGLDSITAVEYVKSINKAFGINLSATDLYDHPTVTRLTEFVLQYQTTAAVTENHVEPLVKTSYLPDIAEEEVADVLEVSPVLPSLMKQEVGPQLALLLQEALYLDEEIQMDRKFIDYGLDSITGVEYVRAINKSFGINMSATDLYDHPSVAALTDFVLKQLTGTSAKEKNAVPLKQMATAPVAESKPAPVIKNGNALGYLVNGVQDINMTSLQQVFIPDPAAGEVQIKVMASSINFPDIMCIKGFYPTIPPYPFIPGFEVSGTVMKVGKDVAGIETGINVIALTGKNMGGHCSYVNVPAELVVKKPANISFEEACSLPVVFITTYYALQHAGLKENEKLLIQTAAGGCGLMALQLANLLGAISYGSSGREEKMAFLRDVGVYHAGNYKRETFEQDMRQHTQGKGFDVVLNMLSGSMIQTGLNLLASGGRYAELAVQGLKTSSKLDLSRLTDNQEIKSIDLRRLFLSGSNGMYTVKEALTTMVEMIESGAVYPVVSRIYPLSAIGEAMAFVETGAHIGKVIISHTATTIDDLSGKLKQRLQAQQRNAHSFKSSRTAVSHAVPATAKHIDYADIAVVGMAARMPGAPDTTAFWENLKAGKNSVTEIPDTRWPQSSYYSEDTSAKGKAYCKWMGVLEDIDKFDPLFFNISPKEAEMMDPQQRIFLEECWKAIEDAGYDPKGLANKRCGVFTGVTTGDYHTGQQLAYDNLDAHVMTGGSSSILSARISYLLNLKGPCVSIDTACSSALVALAQACDSLVMRNSDMAIAGGVSVLSTPVMHIMASKAGMLSPDGKCYTFDNRANGFVPAEGVGVVILKRLDEAVADGDHIYGVIKGWGVNQDGATNGITAPSKDAQVILERGVYEKFGIDPASINYVEAHGTGTKLGDPIEVKALIASFSPGNDNVGYCGIGSVKSNIGHTLTASGIAAVIKVLLSLRNRQLPPTLNYQLLNEHLDLSNTPFYVNTSLKDWQTINGMPRKAAISSFGFSGTNAHVVIEEFNTSETMNAGSTKPVLVVLSAKDKNRLQEQVERLRDYLHSNPVVSPAALAYTLQIGRAALEERLGIIAKDRNELLVQLDSYLQNKTAGLFTGNVRKYRADQLLENEVISALKNQQLSSLAQLWVRGVAVDWTLLYPDHTPHRISLPGYPFAKESYWIPAAVQMAATGDVNKLHPLLHENTSTLKEQQFTSIYSGKESFLHDHKVRAEKIFPGVAYLELARAAGKYSIGAPVTLIKDITWLRPLHVNGTPESVFTGLFPSGSDTGYEIYTRNKGTKVVHSKGTLSTGVQNVPAAQDIMAIRTRLQESVSGLQLYELLRSSGIEHGRSFQGIERLWYSDKEVLSRISLSREEGYVLTPGILDSALQTCAGLSLSQGSQALLLPFGIKEIAIYKELTDTCWCYVRRPEGPAGRMSGRYDIDLLDVSGEVLLSFRDFVSLPADNTGMAVTHMFGNNWQAREITATDNAASSLVLLVGAPIGLSDKLQAMMGVEVDVLAEGSAEIYFVSVMEKVKALLMSKRATRILVVCNTTEYAEYGFITGLLNTATQEFASVTGTVVGVENLSVAHLGELVNILEAELQSPDREVRYRNGIREVKTLQAIPANSTAAKGVKIKEGGVYLITGGAGGLGLIFAAHISRIPNTRIILTGRSRLTEEKLAALAKIPNTEYYSCDITDKAAVEALINTIRKNYNQLDGIIHSAGTTRDSFIINKTNAEISEVLAPKIAGASNLDEVTKDDALDFMVVFSSVAGVIGNIGQADYAAANAWLDNFAFSREEKRTKGKRKGKTLSINWPLWKDGGMQVDAAYEQQMEHRWGILPLPVQQGLLAFDILLESTFQQGIVAYGKAGITAESFNSKPGKGTIPAGNKDEQDEQQLAAVGMIREILADELKLPLDRIEEDTPFQQYGMDSIVAVKLVNRINERLHTALVVIDVFNYPDILSLAARAVESGSNQVPDIITETPVRFASPEEQVITDNSDMAIVALGGLFAEAEHPDELWNKVKTGASMKGAPIGTSFQYGAVSATYQDIYKEKLGITPEAFMLMSRQQQLIFSALGQAMHTYNITGTGLCALTTGVFIGAQQVFLDDADLDRLRHDSHMAYLIPNKISFQLNLKGPSEMINTYCTSVYVALHRALQSIRLGECEQAIIGGVNVVSEKDYKGNAIIGLSDLLSPDELTRSFCDNGAGFVRSEGAGVLIITSLQQAKKDNKHVLAIIKGSAVYHDGRGFSLEAPSAKGIKEAISRSFANSGVNPATIDYVEAHGIANRMADAIEVGAISNAYSELSTNPDKKWRISSVKPTVGHPELASGMASLIKVIKAFQHKTIPGIPGLTAVNKELDPGHAMLLEQDAVYWKNGSYPRRAALNSYAVGGVNAHIILEEYKSANGSIPDLVKQPEVTDIPVTDTVATSPGYQAQLSALVKTIFDIELTDIDRTLSPVDYNFDSVKVIRFIREVNETLELDIRIGQVFGADNFGAFFDLLEGAWNNKKDHAFPVYPLSEGQQGLWFIQQLEPGNTSYNVPVAFTLSGKVSPENFREALSLLLKEYPVLNTNIVRDAQTGVLTYKIKKELTSLSYDHATLGETQDIKTMFQQWLRIPFNLERDLLVRAYTRYDQSMDKTYILFVIHHIIFDGISATLFHSSFFDKYKSLEKGIAIQPLTPDMACFDFSAWEQAYLRSREGNQSAAYWQSMLAGNLPLLSLPYDLYPVKDAPDRRIGSERLQLGKEELILLKKRSKELNINSSILLQGIFNVLLYRLSGNEDILTLSPTAGRPKKEHERSIGYYVNMMVSRTKIRPAMHFDELVKEMKQAFISSIDHVAYPFPRLVAALNLSQRYGDEQLFGVCYSYLNIFDTVLNVHPDVELLDEPYQETAFVYAMEVHDLRDELVILLKYNQGAFTSTAIHRHLQYFHELLTGILSEPTGALKDYRMLPEKEWHHLLVERNNTAVVYPQHKTLTSLFDEQVEKTPDHIAVVYNGEKISYRQLHNKACRLANYLKKAGLPLNAPVSIVSHKSLEQIWGVLGILMAGGHYIPVKGNLPVARLNELIIQTESQFVLVQEEYMEKVDCPPGVKLILLDEKVFAGEKLKYVPVRTQDTALAYIIFTSGSTGKPKGVMIDHRGAVNTLYDMNARFGITANDKIFGISDLNFDLSVYDIFGTFACGATLVLPAESERYTPAAWSRYVADAGVTIWNSVPQLVKLLIDHQEAKGGNDLSGLRLYFMSGDWIPLDLPDRIRRLNPGSKVISLGGATEGSIWSIYYPVDKVDPSWKSIPYGYPLGNQSMYVLDSSLSPAPLNVPGDIYIGGIGVAKGYHKDPEKTAASFMYHPLLNQPLYRTGDRGFQHPDGYIVFLGRQDGQVKINGYRVELGEIETLLQQSPLVRECVVLAIDDGNRNKRLACYVVPEHEFDKEAIREYLKCYLPEYMVPSMIIPINAITLTENGKVDRSLLPATDQHSLNVNRYVEPQDEIEKELALIWQELLRAEKVGVTDDFFELGGNSLLMIQLADRINRQFEGIALQLIDIMKRNTISQMKLLIKERQQGVTVISDRDPHIILLREGHHESVTFIIPGALGATEAYLNLSAQLPGSGAVYGLQMKGMYGDAPAYKTIEEMAQHNISLMAQVPVNGKIQLMGHSYAGIVIYEMLKHIGSVDMVTLLDCYTNPLTLSDEEEIVRMVLYFKGLISFSGISTDEKAIEQLCATMTARPVLERLPFICSIVNVLPAQMILNMWEVYNTSLSAHYTPDIQLDQPLRFVKADNSQLLGGKWEQNGDTSWYNYFNKVTMVSSAGDHFSMINEPWCSSWIAKL